MAFKKGDKKPANSGRKKGSVNKLNKTLKEAIISALERSGGEEWLMALAKKDMRTFAALVGRVLPTEIAGADGKPIEHEHTVTVRYVDPAPPIKLIPE